VHKVAQAFSATKVFVKLAAPRRTKVGDGGKLYFELPTRVETPLDSLERGVGHFLVGKLDVHVAHHVVAQVLHHLHILHFTVFAHLLKYVFEKVIQILLKTGLVHLLRIASTVDHRHHGIGPHVLD
jgi:hypothetical protein